MFKILFVIGASVGLNAPLDIHVPTREDLYLEQQKETRKESDQKEDNPYEEL